MGFKLTQGVPTEAAAGCYSMRNDLEIWLRRSRYDDSRMGWFSGITTDNYNYTFNPPKPLNACERRCQEQEQCDSFPGQYTSAYGGALFTLAIIKYSTSPSVAPAWCPISRLSSERLHWAWESRVLGCCTCYYGKTAGHCKLFVTSSLGRGCKSTCRQVALCQ
jgi:hypothetical protein